MLARGNKTETSEHCLNFEIGDVLKKKTFYLFLKRVFDIYVSVIGLIILLPVFFIVSIAIKTDSIGPVFYRQLRVGKYGKGFNIIKFRTMVTGAEKQGMQITVGGDNRITKLGHFLRKFKIDELPQLINVLMGDMSLVGPRPEVPQYVDKYRENQRIILKVKPGITDLASIEYRNENDLLAEDLDPEDTYINEIMPKKIELNIVYLKKMSILYDIRLIIKTVLIIFK